MKSAMSEHKLAILTTVLWGVLLRLSAKVPSFAWEMVLALAAGLCLVHTLTYLQRTRRDDVQPPGPAERRA